MMQVYVRGSDKAVALYQKAFGAKLVVSHPNDDGTYMHAELDVYGQILALSELPEGEAITGNTMQFCLHFGKGKEALVKRIYETLKEDCIEITAPITAPGECPWSPCLFGLIDQFGVNWCVFV